jgi:hypothetical protein
MTIEIKDKTPFLPSIEMDHKTYHDGGKSSVTLSYVGQPIIHSIQLPDDFVERFSNAIAPVREVYERHLNYKNASTGGYLFWPSHMDMDEFSVQCCLAFEQTLQESEVGRSTLRAFYDLSSGDKHTPPAICLTNVPEEFPLLSYVLWGLYPLFGCHFVKGNYHDPLQPRRGFPSRSGGIDDKKRQGLHNDGGDPVGISVLYRGPQSKTLATPTDLALIDELVWQLAKNEPTIRERMNSPKEEVPDIKNSTPMAEAVVAHKTIWTNRIRDLAPQLNPVLSELTTLEKRYDWLIKNRSLWSVPSKHPRHLGERDYARIQLHALGKFKPDPVKFYLDYLMDHSLYNYEMATPVLVPKGGMLLFDNHALVHGRAESRETENIEDAEWRYWRLFIDPVQGRKLTDTQLKGAAKHLKAESNTEPYQGR